MIEYDIVFLYVSLRLSEPTEDILGDSVCDWIPRRDLRYFVFENCRRQIRARIKESGGRSHFSHLFADHSFNSRRQADNGHSDQRSASFLYCH